LHSSFPYQEDERSHLLAQYRVVTAEAERQGSQFTRLESESTGLRRDLVSRDVELRRLREQNELLEAETQEVRVPSCCRSRAVVTSRTIEQEIPAEIVLLVFIMRIGLQVREITRSGSAGIAAPHVRRRRFAATRFIH